MHSAAFGTDHALRRLPRLDGTMKLVWAATAGAIGCNLGSLIAYEIGCYGGRPLVERYGAGSC